MYKIVINNNEVILFTQANRVETASEVQEFETVDAALSYIEANNLSLAEGIVINDNGLSEAKARKTAEIEAAYDNAISAGLEVNSIIYPIHDKAVEQLNVLLNNFTAQKQLGAYVGTDLKYLIDNNYDTQQVAKDDYLTAIMSVIDYREQLHFNKALKLSQIQQATTIEEVEQITF